MPSHQAQRLLPYSRQQLFSLIADIESYPAFMPGYQAARIVQRVDDRLKVEQRVGLGPLAYSFNSEARLEPPGRITIHAEDGPFARLDVEWQLTPKDTGCRVTLVSRYELRHPLLGQIAGQLMAFSADHCLERIARRANQLFS